MDRSGAGVPKQHAGRRLSGPAVAAAVLLGFIIAAAALAPLIARDDPLEQDVERRLAAPGPRHLFGTDGFGRDVFSRVLHGGRSTLFVAFASVALAAVAGGATGVFSGYVGGRFDLVYQRFIDVLLGFPSLVLALVFVVALQPSEFSLTIAIAVALLPRVERVARAAAAATAGEPYITAARSIGAGTSRIAFRHVLPNSLSPIIAQISGYIGTAVIAEASLSFLGLGVPPPYPSWGRMLQEGARQYLEAAPWVTIFPGLFISLTVVSCAVLGDGIRDLVDRRRSQPL